MLTNCVNCGAILHGNKCEYCGTEYGEERQSITAEFDCMSNVGELKVGDKTYKVYISKIEAKLEESRSYVGIDGMLHRTPAITRHKFELIEF